MQYTSTRGQSPAAGASQAVVRGIAPDGGLYVPRAWPELPAAVLETPRAAIGYQELSRLVMGPFLPEYTAEELQEVVDAAYNRRSFDHAAITPLHSLEGDLHVLELWHGPTLAFKDLALQFLPRFLTRAARKTGLERELLILVATSGDTGKAALEGFRNVPGTRVVVFYPRQGVSPMQELQMVTQEGENVGVVAVEGHFDDAQRGVKSLFADRGLQDKLADRGYAFSSANSINWGRLLPQLVYYFWAYRQLVQAGRLEPGQTLNYAVPTGNFGNILAGYYARKLGLPLGKLILAANANNVLHHFLEQGVYDSRRPLERTISPSMDILVASNLERLLFDLAGGDSRRVQAWMQELGEGGQYRVDREVHRSLRQLFWSHWAGDEETREAIARVHRDCGYLLDPHTAVAWTAQERYRGETGDQTPLVILSTASPFKFAESVIAALGGAVDISEVPGSLLERLHGISGWPIPAPLRDLDRKPVRHRRVAAPGALQESLLELLP